MPVALITGASRGLGRALATALAREGWSLVVDARDPEALTHAAEAWRTRGAASIVAVPGDVSDPDHRVRLATAVDQLAALDLLVNNASLLGPSPQPRLADYPWETLERVLSVNTVAPLALAQLLLPTLRSSGGAVLNVTSDAAVEPYEGWGGYGASKAALEQWTSILAAEEPDIRVYALDPGDMRTQMHQEAYPGEDISDRPAPETVVPALLRLVHERPASGRYRAAALLDPTSTGASA